MDLCYQSFPSETERATSAKSPDTTTYERKGLRNTFHCDPLKQCITSLLNLHFNYKLKVHSPRFTVSIHEQSNLLKRLQTKDRRQAKPLPASRLPPPPKHPRAVLLHPHPKPDPLRCPQLTEAPTVRRSCQAQNLFSADRRELLQQSYKHSVGSFFQLPPPPIRFKFPSVQNAQWKY